ncbi:hypothetical protein CCHL11_04221 [Colletotrichum chlorophyti]|uniref:N-acetyltransferase domain-containing protein n=1 Tax=Colletotrichum chlorophyti TaxID=708187 RepID=A0A1Q8RPH2_9PEZI|nr:hypothetical protein CCHL11_04221 [Colletotrichum chlorophyti]
MATHNVLQLKMVTLDDIPAITDLWYAAFTDPGMRAMLPDTPGNEANRGDFLNKPFQRYITVVDPGATDARGRPRIVASAKWNLSMPEGRGRRRGAGSMLVKWGCDLADEDGVGLYLDASKDGAFLYKRVGFVDEIEAHAGEVASMARKKRD